MSAAGGVVPIITTASSGRSWNVRDQPSRSSGDVPWPTPDGTLYTRYGVDGLFHRQDTPGVQQSS